MLNVRLTPLIAIALACIGPCISLTASAEIYRWTDEEGNTVYSDQNTSSQARATTPSDNNVSYYSAPLGADKPAPTITEFSDTLATLESADDDTDEQDQGKALTEQDCQQQYQRSCDQVNNWERYAREACGDDPRCDDANFLDRKYRPRSQAELREVARKAAIRNNNVDDKIETFLRKKYSNYCENQAIMICEKKRSRSCLSQMEAQCEDPRTLGDILAKYDNLSPAEKQEIIAKAKAMAKANGENALDYDQMLASLIEILISQALLGI